MPEGATLKEFLVLKARVILSNKMNDNIRL